MADAPLKGVRVIELARILAGPWAGQLLADLGADVIKIEHPEGGDDTRRWGPPFVTGADGENLSAAYYHSTNRGKRSITLDIASAEGAQAVRDLIATADVVIENFKVGGLRKYGLDYDSLKEANPALVYCSITGFGQTGPYAPRAGYDFIIQAMAGMMSITGEPGREPQKAGVAISDIFTGLYSVIAIQAALRHAEKSGEGQMIDMALFDTQAGILGNQNLNYLVSGTAPVQMGNAHMNIAPYEVFPVSDGHVIIAVGNDGQFQRFCKLLGAEALGADPDFQTNPSRVTHRTRLRAPKNHLPSMAKGNKGRHCWPPCMRPMPVARPGRLTIIAECFRRSCRRLSQRAPAWISPEQGRNPNPLEVRAPPIKLPVLRRCNYAGPSPPGWERHTRRLVLSRTLLIHRIQKGTTHMKNPGGQADWSTSLQGPMDVESSLCSCPAESLSREFSTRWSISGVGPIHLSDAMARSVGKRRRLGDSLPETPASATAASPPHPPPPTAASAGSTSPARIRSRLILVHRSRFSAATAAEREGIPEVSSYRRGLTEFAQNWCSYVEITMRLRIFTLRISSKRALFSVGDVQARPLVRWFVLACRRCAAAKWSSIRRRRSCPNRFPSNRPGSRADGGFLPQRIFESRDGRRFLIPRRGTRYGP